ncbi:acetyl-CoA acetyltransferase [Corynebacterium choanae]|uniref:Acetyl-CoA acetyltransferase n=1 Tax=Corynebacterium choanae TaxID=1862358 RepID=A0A3G6J8H0_9CORY|nr:acetyl-CoA acetyltransferase [Corynebacterium choanae]AZA14405.1 hypothetical protein CCHOA_10110 [Corynebacterium choanae]
MHTANTATPTREHRPSTPIEVGFDINGEFTKLWTEVADTVGYQPRTFTDPHRYRAASPAHDPFEATYGIRLPRDFRQEAIGMDWHTFQTVYSPTPDWRITQIAATPLRGARIAYSMDIAIPTPHGRTHSSHSFTGTGPVQAITQTLAALGRSVEITSFHQHDLFEATVTFLQVRHNRKQCWVAAFGPTRDQSSANALAIAAYRLHAR